MTALQHIHFAVAEELVRCKPWIDEALKHCGGTHVYDDIVDAVLSHDMQLWPAKDAAVVTSILVQPRKRVLYVFLAGGRLQTLRSLHPTITRWAKREGCSLAMMTGRLGWPRALQDLPGMLAPQSLLMMEI
jgi:hypothetical protein